MNSVYLLMLSGLVLLTGCAANDTAIFVTKTSVSIMDADSTPPNISIAYNREEGYFGPRYNSGAVPSLFASIRSDGNIINPKIDQLYATGNAAEIATGVDPSNVTVDTSQMTGDEELMFFGTTTSIGFKVDIGPNFVPKGLLLGFRRKEYSVVPLATDAKTKDGEKNSQGVPVIDCRH